MKNEKLNILIFGCGAIGSTFGGFLSRSEHMVYLYGRAWHLDKVRSSGLKVEGIWGRHRFRNFQIFTSLAQLRKKKVAFDLVLLTVKSFDTERACRDLRPFVSRQTVLLALQNGLGNIEVLHRHFAPRQVMAGRVIFGTELFPGRIKITVSADDVLIGETEKNGITGRARQLARLFTECGVRARAVRDIRGAIWLKAIFNCALNPAASLLGVHYGYLMETPHTRELMRRVIEEIYAVAAREKVRLTPRTAAGYLRLFFRHLVPATYDHHPSMLQDLSRGKPTEIGALNGAIVRLAGKHGLDVPANQCLTELVRARESWNFNNRSKKR